VRSGWGRTAFCRPLTQFVLISASRAAAVRELHAAPYRRPGARFDRYRRLPTGAPTPDPNLARLVDQQAIDLTHALRQRGLVDEMANLPPGDDVIDVEEWVRYAEIDVPRLYLALTDEPIRSDRDDRNFDHYERGLQPAGSHERYLQRPTLFNFRRSKAERVLMRISK
jgi:hypothetical protein